MDQLKRIVTGLAFVAIIAIAMLASGSDAYAKSRSGGGNRAAHGSGDVFITVTPEVGGNDILLPLGVTWE